VCYVSTAAYTPAMLNDALKYDNCYIVSKDDFVDYYPPIQEEVMSTFWLPDLFDSSFFQRLAPFYGHARCTCQH
jgi:hypothetical protein